MQLDVFGVPSFEVGIAEDCPWRWPGQYEDGGTGLFYNRWRYYSVGTGEYAAFDPLGLDGSLRLSSYVDDPVFFIDPLGLKACNIHRSTIDALGDAPAGMSNPHLHHIVMEGAFTHWRSANRRLVTRSRAILRRHGIDLQGTRNVMWAPNEGHSVEYAREVHRVLAAADSRGTEAVQRALGRLRTRIANGTLLRST
jgi:RHS repeat-associated protein